jgi:L-lactate dehydrogenase complex protein LldG
MRVGKPDMERKEFLGRVRQAVSTADLPPISEVAPGAFLGDLRIDNLLDRFVERATDVNCVVKVIDATDALDQAISIMVEYGADEYLGWADSQMPIPGIGAGLIANGFFPRPFEVPSEDRLHHQNAYSDLIVGITGADGGLAESGSIVLTHGPNRSRMASLIPEVHVALLPASLIVDSLSHWAASRPESLTRSVNLVVISGPSRTGDIEMHLTQGVHGPRHVHVLVLGDR